ncbi:MAG: hypothetical protein P1V97_34985 [Planctomycetota bacterium]|nr:hypothetical protein [Planctomycetota bacterium]
MPEQSVLRAPKKGHSLRGPIGTHNLFFMASALFMLMGCFGLRGALQEHLDKFSSNFVLLFILNVYEIAVLGLCYFLKKKHRSNDVNMLAALCIFLMFDPTFTVVKSFAQDWLYAWSVYATFTVLLLVKGAFLFRFIFEWKPNKMVLCFLGGQQLAFLALPAFYWLLWWELHYSQALSGHMSWWVGSLFCILWMLADKEKLFGNLFHSKLVMPWLQKFILNAPYAALGVHIVALHFALRIPFYVDHLAPMLLAGSLASVVKLKAGEVLPRHHFYLGILAVSSCLYVPFELILYPNSLALSPLRMVLLSSSGIFAYGAFRSKNHLGSALSAMTLSFALLGESPQRMANKIDTVGEMVWRFLPTSRLSISAWLVFLGFAFLVAGGYASSQFDLFGGIEEVEDGYDDPSLDPSSPLESSQSEI